MYIDNLKENVLDLYNSDWFESTCLEFKSARGGLPKEMWPTYSAFANTQGGIILLGVEDDGSISGINNPTKYKNEIFTQLNNPQKCSINLCDESMLKTVKLEGKNIIALYVPQATPSQKPVYIRDREDNSYIRSASADIRCKREDIVRMRRNRDIAECPTYSLDDTIIPHTTLEDLDKETLKKFRNRVRSTQIGTTWQDLDDLMFLKKFGAYKKDRHTGVEGLTLAGLLMLGNSDALAELRPYYQVDYFEYEETDNPNARWSDRITNDGTWSGNLYDFFFLVLPRLVSNLKRPFHLNDNLLRQDESPAHIAVREALANALIHADYHEMFGIRIEKSPKGLVFMNPGILLVPRELMFSEQAHISICRNKALQRMFQALGIVDHAGSGIDKIVQGWLDYCISIPTVEEHYNPDRVVWKLDYVGIISKENLATVAQSIGKSNFEALDLFDKLILVCIASTQTVRHTDIAPLLPLHAFDISKRLGKLVMRGILIKSGRTKGTKYTIAKKKEIIPTNADTEKKKNGTEYPPLIQSIRTSSWISKQDMQEAIVHLCSQSWLTSDELAQLLSRDTSTIRKKCILLCRNNILEFKYIIRGKNRSRTYHTIS